MDFCTVVNRPLRKLAPHVKTMGKGTLATDGYYKCVVRAFLVKTYAFARHATKKAPEPFFNTATLRGICEDFIVLSHLGGVENRDTVVRAYAAEQMKRDLVGQRAFFDKVRPYQPTYVPPADLRREIDDERTANRLPKFESMANGTGLGDLYDFLYSGTSRWVHFSPGLLLRMGWGDAPSRDAVEQANCTFSTANFSDYYQDFNRFYGLYFVVLAFRRFSEEFNKKSEVLAIVETLDAALHSRLRWPELVTFEELNMRNPHVLERVLMKRLTAEKIDR